MSGTREVLSPEMTIGLVTDGIIGLGLFLSGLSISTRGASCYG